jgi:hypothetical protein
MEGDRVKIALVTACIGTKYLENAKALISSAEFYFLRDTTIFIFTDLDPVFSATNIHTCPVPSPLSALFRYHYLWSIRERLEHYDLIYWIDADCEIMKPVTTEIIPDYAPLVAAAHPWYDMSRGPFEENPASTAYVGGDNYFPYLQGCFQGGERKAFLDMCEVLKNNIEVDLSKRIIARWYDESHLNRYSLDHPFKILHPGYAYPDKTMDIPYPRVINHFNGHDPVKGFD